MGRMLFKFILIITPHSLLQEKLQRLRETKGLVQGYTLMSDRVWIPADIRRRRKPLLLTAAL